MAAGESFRSGNLQPGFGLGENPQNVSLAADNTSIFVTRNQPWLRLVSNDTTAANRTFTLTSGPVDGYVLTLTLVPNGAVTTGRAQLLSTGNVNLSGGTWEPAVNDYLTLQWDALSATWREVARQGAGQQLVAGTYTPTFLAGTNVATATAGLAHYQRIGNQVFVSGTGSIASTAAANTASAFTVTLPIASDLAAAGDVTGSGDILSATGTASAGVVISAEITANTATFAYNAAQTAAGTLGYTFAYTVI